MFPLSYSISTHQKGRRFEANAHCFGGVMHVQGKQRLSQPSVSMVTDVSCSWLRVGSASHSVNPAPVTPYWACLNRPTVQHRGQLPVPTGDQAGQVRSAHPMDWLRLSWDKGAPQHVCCPCCLLPFILVNMWININCKNVWFLNLHHTGAECWDGKTNEIIFQIATEFVTEANICRTMGKNNTPKEKKITGRTATMKPANKKLFVFQI